MNPTVTGALVGAGGAVIVAVAGFIANVRNTRATTAVSQHAVEAAQRTVERTEQARVADRYTKAIDQLGSDQLDVRIGGIYALERIARDYERDRPTVMEVLAAFSREHSLEQWPPPERADVLVPERMTRPDVQAALTVIGRRDAIHGKQRIDLHSANLTRARLHRANLTRTNLTKTDLTSANLTKTDLTGADLIGANLSRADLTGADLTGADLTRADLTGADLTGANLTRAAMTAAKLIGATLTSMNLTGASLADADLTNTDLTRVDLTGANLTYAHLIGVNLTNKELTGVDLSGADLSHADLTGAQWSEGVQPPSGWVQDPEPGREL